MTAVVAAGKTWARGLGVSLVATDAATALADPALVRALLDGIAHAHEGPLSEFPSDAEWYLVRESRADVGVAVVQRNAPRAGEASLLGLAVAPEHRGRALASKALLVIERRLARDGIARVLARVSRTNGRGLYFMLRVGYTPVPTVEVPAGEHGDVTWFARGRRN